MFICIGSVAAAVGIDTGDTEFAPEPRPGRIRINEALFQQLRNAGVAMQPMKSIKGLNCRGETYDRAQWRVQEAPLLFITPNGHPIFRYAPPVIEVFPDDDKCGIIGAASVPFGLMGALYMRLWGTVIIDFLNERVWVSPKHALPLYGALAVAWNNAGAWDLHRDASLERSKEKALSTCNEKYGRCALVSLFADPSEFMCLAIARNIQNTSRLSVAKGDSLKEVQQSVLELCAHQHGGTCRIEYAVCNN